MPATPRYQEIADDIREAIMNERALGPSQLGPAAQLPTEPQLAEHYNASRTTIRNALRVLTSEGLLETRGRLGTYVRRLPLLQHPGAPTARPVFRTFSEQVAAGAMPSEEFRFRIEPADVEIARQLQVEPDTLVAVRSVLRFIDGVPWGRQTYYFPLDIAEKVGLTVPHSLEQGSLGLLTEAGYPETGTVTRTWARLATREEAATFDLGAGVYVLLYRETGYSGGRPTRTGLEVLPADRNEIVERRGEVPDSAR